MKKKSFDGLLVIDKPSGVTSRDVVNRIQRLFPKRTRIGHTGTLDPLATGVLVLCIGKATRLAEYVQRMTKVYRTVAKLGAVSNTDDADGEITPYENASTPTKSEMEHTLSTFIGKISQVPPAFSAARVTGERAYSLARQGKSVTLEPRTVRIDQINLMRFEDSEMELEITCGKGTYIRSLIRDVGENLGCGGYVEQLRRMRVGTFTVEEAHSSEIDVETARNALLPIERAVTEIPALTLTTEQATQIRHGQRVSIQHEDREEVALFDETGSLIGFGQCREKTLSPKKVLAT